MPDFTVIVTITTVVRARGPEEAKRRIDEQLDKAIDEISEMNWHQQLRPEVEYYIERI